MHIIDEAAFLQIFEQSGLQAAYRVPAHMRYLKSFAGLETDHVGAEDAHTLHIAFFGTAAHQLQSDADAKYRLRQGGNELRKSAILQGRHRAGSVADSGQHHLVGLEQQVPVGSEHRLRHPRPVEGIDDRTDVSYAIINDCDHRSPLLLGSS